MDSYDGILLRPPLIRKARTWQPPKSAAAVGHRQGNNEDFILRAKAYIERFIDDKGLANLQPLASHLFNWAIDFRSLRFNWDYLAKYGGPSPGINDLRYDLVEDSDVNRLLRRVHDDLLSGEFRGGPRRSVSIPKAPKPGFRTLELPNIEDRVVARSVLWIIGPILRATLSPMALGFRPTDTRHRAVARVASKATSMGRYIWVTSDILQAFDHVPVKRLMDVFQRYVPSPRIAQIVRSLVGPQSRGIPQGGPLGSALMNIYLHHFLDRKHLAEHPGVPAYRWVDDVLVQCSDQAEAEAVWKQLDGWLRPNGLELKGSIESDIHDVRGVDGAEWLGFKFRADHDGFRFDIADAAYDKLKKHLKQDHSLPDSPQQAVETIRGWIQQQGPCYEHANRDVVLERVREICSDLSFDELPVPNTFNNWWRTAHLKWKVTRAEENEEAAP